MGKKIMSARTNGIGFNYLSVPTCGILATGELKGLLTSLLLHKIP